MPDRKDEHGLDEHPAAADDEIPDDEVDDDIDDDELAEIHQEARRKRAEAQRRQDIEHASQDRETDALEQENPNYHRDEAPENS